MHGCSTQFKQPTGETYVILSAVKFNGFVIMVDEAGPVCDIAS
jgi:hypothetical protein